MTKTTTKTDRRRDQGRNDDQERAHDARLPSDARGEAAP